jgi:hypothetical protein
LANEKRSVITGAGGAAKLDGVHRDFNSFDVGGLAFCHLKDARILYCSN